MGPKELSRLYKVWWAMRNRCGNQKDASYKDYGGRGISVCQRWQESFANFFFDMGPCPRGWQLDRYPDNNGNYEPGNVRWATRQQNAVNKRSTRHLTAFGETRNMQEWARACGVSHSLIHLRLAQGWSVEDAVTTPAAARPNSKLTDEQAREIKRKYTGARGEPAALAKEYGVTHRTITQILQGKTFVDV